jgi:hypothetical protein
LETLGFVAMGTDGCMILSADGMTWNPPSVSMSGISLSNKAIYSSVDKGVFTTPNGYLSREKMHTLMFTNDGMTTDFYQMCNQITNFAISFTMLTYDSANDTYIAVGFNNCGSIVTRLPRSYNKNTQFVLPILYNRFIKAL